ncbi:uncharacterized protein B0T15DRAFT_501728 [Chaetomium strumarium]|uniref:Uncharacterized protein n=1 Tax=Chaetomium strumarium TaxID=1170767 RepID=A0AAJ0M304_9PEZI|nr:hypothetical protein B0T15DRAFT_501728 [Chaetomium strumarium]
MGLLDAKKHSTEETSGIFSLGVYFWLNRMFLAGYNEVLTLEDLAAPALSQSGTIATLESVSGCAAVVSTTAICSTCMTVDCVVPATITAGCGTCPDTPPTIYRSYGCDEGCGAEGLGGCKTVYSVVTASGDDGECDGGGGGDDDGSPAPTTTGSDGHGPTTPTTTQSETEVTALPTPSGSSNGTDGQVTAPVSTAGAAARLRPFRLW